MKIRNALTIAQNDIITGKGLEFGYGSKNRHGYEPVRVGLGSQYVGGDDDSNVDVSDPTRTTALFLVQEVKHDGKTTVTAIRLDDNFDHCHGSEIVQFEMGSDPACSVVEVQQRGAAKTAATIKEGDVIQSGRFSEAKLLKHQQDPARLPTCLDCFVVLSLSKQGGGQSGHRSTDVYPDGLYVKAVRLNSDNTYTQQSDRVEFYMSGSFIRDVLVNAVWSAGTVKESLTKVKIAV